MKEFYHSKKKKIRGWKRHKRKIDRWKQHVIDLDMVYVREYQRDYAKLWIHPFYSLVQRNPPNWFNCLLLNAMLDVHLNWHAKMIAEQTDFYLKIWLYDPHFIRSQLVVAYKDYIHFYDQTFDKNHMTKTFPLYKYKSLEDKLGLFDWELAIDTAEYWASDLREDVAMQFKTAKEVEEILDKSYSRLSSGDDVLYRVHAGDVWIGTLKNIVETVGGGNSF